MKYLPNCWVVDAKDNVLADESHHFGLHPLHFHRVIYMYIASCVEMICDSQEITDVPRDIVRKKIIQNMDMKKYYLNLDLENLK